MNRRDFLIGLGAGAVGGAAVTAGIASRGKESASVSYPGQPTGAAARFNWRLVTSWPPDYPGAHEGLKRLAADLGEISGGRLNIQVYGAGELVAGLEVFDAVSQGTVEMAHSASYYWAGKIPATQFFCAVPFGMIAQEQNSWFYNGGGIELWREIYARSNMTVFPAGNTGTQMGGWFRKEIRNADDFKGLKMRIPGLGGKVVAAVGATVVLLAASEIFPALERGVIDAAEWVGPYVDRRLGLHQAAKYYYYPGWHEPGTANELMVNLNAFNSLPKELQVALEDAAYRLNLWLLSIYQPMNVEALQDLVQNQGVKLMRYPDDLLDKLKTESDKIVAQLAESDADSRKVYESYKKSLDGSRAWRNVSEDAYNMIMMRA
jgi:TRAP-type mannitol/chloroaromatic compound transport system substrate-binding protein